MSHILHDITFSLESGTCIALLGRNGMGKTTIIRTICGLTKLTSGKILLDGIDVSQAPTYKLARAGIALAPEGRGIFHDLTVKENILVANHDNYHSRNNFNLAYILQLFPKLKNRLNHMGNQLSGGEQQMVSIGRALCTNPKLLILDEATEGLAPLMRQEIWHAISKIRQMGITTLIVDKDADALMKIADRCIILEKGSVAYDNTAQALQDQPNIRKQLLGI